jgi:uncharacterized membrane protein
MTDLIVLASANERDAAKIRDKLFEWKKQRLLQSADAALVLKRPDGKIQVQHDDRLVDSSASQGILLNFVLWMSWQEMIANPLNNLWGGNIGVDDQFVQDISRIMKPNQLVLFLLVANFPEDKLRGQLQKLNVTILKRSLSQKDEALLKETFGG